MDQNNFPNSDNWDLKNDLVKELSEGRELARQLQNHLNAQSSSHEIRDFLLHKILNSYDQALSMIRRKDAKPPAVQPVVASDSPRSLTGSDDSDQDNFKDHQPSRKRKEIERWTQRVQVRPGSGLEGQLDDGYGWRKYGQKDILGAKYPRGYYRCTHRHGQGCLATKQVQRSDDDPTIIEILYRGRHTCNQGANPSNINQDPPIQDEDTKPNAQNANQLVQNQPGPLFNIQTSLRVITHDFDTSENPPFDPFNFPSSSSINQDNNYQLFPDSNFMGNYSPNLISPSTSGSNYFSISPSILNNNYERSVHNLHVSESELNPVVSTTTSATNSPTIGMRFPFSSSGFDSHFSFGYPDCFP